MEFGDLLAVFLAPVAVLVGEDDLADERTEGILVERPERRDGLVGEPFPVGPNERALELCLSD